MLSPQLQNSKILNGNKATLTIYYNNGINTRILNIMCNWHYLEGNQPQICNSPNPHGSKNFFFISLENR